MQETEQAQIERLNPGLGVVEEIEWPDVPRTAHEMTHLREVAWQVLGAHNDGARWVQFPLSGGRVGYGRRYAHPSQRSKKWARVVVYGREGKSKIIKRLAATVTPLTKGEDKLARRAVEVWMSAISYASDRLDAAIEEKLSDAGDLFPGQTEEEGMF